jgi:hypothetical protein
MFKAFLAVVVAAIAFASAPAVPAAAASLPCTSASINSTYWTVPFGSQVHLYATATGCDNPVYQWQAKRPGGLWRTIQPYRTFLGAPNELSWVPAVAAHYAVRVFAQDLYAFQTPVVSALTTATVTATVHGCASETPLLSTPTPAAGGVSVVYPGGEVDYLVTSVFNCTAPRYEFWLESPAGVWSTAQSFSGKASWSWTPAAGAAPGVYHLHIWINQKGDSRTTYESLDAAEIGYVTA